MKQEIIEIPLIKLVPDESQPRKNFDPIKLKSLADSIKSEGGIKNPITVQKIGDKYMIIHGERRFHAAEINHMKTVPSIVEPVQGKTERLVSQFIIQEQNEPWSPIERAAAIADLSTQLGISPLETCKMLKIPGTDGARFAAFAELIDKEAWIRSETPLDYAQFLRTLKVRVRNLVKNELEEEWIKSDDKKLEHRIIALIKSGTILSRRDLVKLSDAFTKEPKLIKKFLSDGKSTPISLFTEAKAEGAMYLRNTVQSARGLAGYGNHFLRVRDIKLSEKAVQDLKSAVAVANKLIALKK